MGILLHNGTNDNHCIVLKGLLDGPFQGMPKNGPKAIITDGATA